MFSNYLCMLADGDGAPYSLLCPTRYAKVMMHGMATTHHKNTKNKLNQRFDLSKGIDAGMGDGLHVSQG